MNDLPQWDGLWEKKKKRSLQTVLVGMFIGRFGQCPFALCSSRSLYSSFPVCCFLSFCSPLLLLCFPLPLPCLASCFACLSLPSLCISLPPFPSSCKYSPSFKHGQRLLHSPGGRKAPRRYIHLAQHDLIPSPHARERWQIQDSLARQRSHSARQELVQNGPVAYHGATTIGPLLTGHGGAPRIGAGPCSILSRTLSDAIYHRSIRRRPKTYPKQGGSAQRA